MKKRSLIFSVMKKAIILSMLFFIYGCIAQKSTEKFKWEQLFNGKDLKDWQIKITNYDLNENFGNTFRVHDGNIQVRYDQYPNFGNQFGHLFYKKPFSYYLIGVEYRFIGDQLEGGAGWAFRNSGIMVHGQDPATMSKSQSYPNSIEVQLLGGTGAGNRSTANACTPGTQFVMNGEVIESHCTNSKSLTFNGDQWVRVEALVLGDSLIVHYVNGEEVLRYEKPQTEQGELIKFGSISLQSESHPVDFRKVEIVNLEKYANDPVKLQNAVQLLMAEKRVAKQ